MWTPGAVHNLSGHGEVTIATPDALAISVTAVPATAGVKVGRPPTYWGLGWLSPGSSSGYLRDVPIRHVSQLELLGLREFDRLGHTLEAGVAVTVTELRSDLAVTRPPPEDRNPNFVSAVWYGWLTNTGVETQLWTYTVPANRRLKVTHLNQTLTRLSATSTPGFGHLYALVLGGILLSTQIAGNVLGQREHNGLGGSELWLGPGQTISCNMYLSEPTGSLYGSANMAGITFDA